MQSESQDTVGKSYANEPFLITSHAKTQTDVTGALPVTVKLPVAHSTLNPVRVASRDIGVIITMSSAFTNGVPMITEIAPAAIAFLPAAK